MTQTMAVSPEEDLQRSLGTMWEWDGSSGEGSGERFSLPSNDSQICFHFLGWFPPSVGLPSLLRRLEIGWVLDVQLDFPCPSGTFCQAQTGLNSPFGPHLFPSCHLVCLSLSLLSLSLLKKKKLFPILNLAQYNTISIKSCKLV